MALTMQRGITRVNGLNVDPYAAFSRWNVQQVPSLERKAIGRRIQQARGELSQREFGLALGYLQPQVSRYERGGIPSSYRFLAGLAARFGTDVNWLLTGRSAAAGGTGAHPVDSMLEAATRAVLRVLGDARAVPSSPLTANTVVRSLPAPMAVSWDRVQLELPMIVGALIPGGAPLKNGLVLYAEECVRRTAPRDGGESERQSIGLAEHPARKAVATDDWRDLLESLRKSAEHDGVPATLAVLDQWAAQLEERDATPLVLERARLLLLWGWLLAESRAEGDSAYESDGCRLLFRLARATRLAGRFDEAEGLYEESRARALELGDRTLLARCQAGLGRLFFEKGDFDRARGHFVAALEEALGLGDPRLLLFAYLDLATYYSEHEIDYAKATEYARSGLEIARREGDLEHAGRFLNELGLNEMELGHTPAAVASFTEALEIAARLRSALLLACANINFGELRLREGALETAQELVQTAREAAARAGITWAECQAEILLARIDHALGRTASALERLAKVEARAATQGLNHEHERARALERQIHEGMLGRLQAFSA